MIVETVDAAPVEGLWFGNTCVSILVSSADGVDGNCLVEHDMPFGEAPPLHVHEREDEIFYVLRGEMLFEVGGSSRTLSAGEAILAPRGVPHRFRVVSPQGVRCLTVTRGADFETMLRSVGRMPTHAGLPASQAPTPAAIAALTAACAANQIVIAGPPLA